MLNEVKEIGRIATDLPSVAPEGKPVRFNLAVNKFLKGGTKKTNFIPITVWGKEAQNLCKFQRKGKKILVLASLESGSYRDKEGSIRYTLDVVAYRIHYLDPKDSDERDISSYEEVSSHMNNSYSSNNLGTNSFGTGGFGTDGFGTDGFGTDGFGTGGFGTGGFGADSFGTGAFDD